jgi:broad specificity phosphatase PhoE
MKTKLTLLRHGISEANAKGILQGQEDWPLSEVGRVQSRNLAEYWSASGVRFSSIISSPLARALETAEIISAALGCPVEEDTLLLERKWGRFENMQLTEVMAYFKQNPPLSLFDQPPPDGESFWQLYSRAGMALQQLLGRQPGEFLIVSHGGLLAAMHMVSLQIAPALASLSGPRIALDNCGYSQLEYDHDQPRWVINNINMKSTA